MPLRPSQESLERKILSPLPTAWPVMAAEPELIWVQFPVVSRFVAVAVVYE